MSNLTTAVCRETRSRIRGVQQSARIVYAVSAHTTCRETRSCTTSDESCGVGLNQSHSISFYHIT